MHPTAGRGGGRGASAQRAEPRQLTELRGQAAADAVTVQLPAHGDARGAVKGVPSAGAMAVRAAHTQVSVLLSRPSSVGSVPDSPWLCRSLCAGWRAAEHRAPASWSLGGIVWEGGAQGAVAEAAVTRARLGGADGAGRGGVHEQSKQEQARGHRNRCGGFQLTAPSAPTSERAARPSCTCQAGERGGAAHDGA